MMLQRQPAASAASTVVLVGCVAAALFGLGSRAVETTSAPIEGRTTTGSALRVASANLMLPSDLPSRRVASASLTPPAEMPAVKVAAANPFPPTASLELPPAKAAAADPFPPMASLDLPAQAAASPAPAPERTYQLASAASMPEPESPVQAVAANPVLPVPEEAVSEHVASVSPTSPAKTLPALGNMMRLASVNPTEPVPDVQPSARREEIPNECLVAQLCIDDYLWSLYQRAPKIDTAKMQERIKVTVKRKGKLRTVGKTITKYVVQDFTWKDPIAAQRANMSIMDYVIGGMDRRFRTKLYQALRTMDAAGLEPGITSAFRDDYRQAIATGNKAASDSSFHGGSRRGGYGHGLAIDLVSVKGDTRMQRFANSEILWKWVDEHEKELGVGRPYLDRDPPHIAPRDGREYAAKRGPAEARRAALEKKKQRTAQAKSKRQPAAARADHGKAKRANGDPGKSKRVSDDRSKTKPPKTASSKARSI